MNSLIWFAVLLVVIWIVARVFLAVTGALLHVLWIIAIIALIVWAVKKIA
ncbi:MAG TPA: hypothetical protein VG095_03925 [Chthoniobacterales bacterium]|nr:hypothetical protein [Chthoniobacterales bacterium]